MPVRMLEMLSAFLKQKLFRNVLYMNKIIIKNK